MEEIAGQQRTAGTPGIGAGDPGSDPQEIQRALAFVEMRREGGQLVPVIKGKAIIKRARNSKKQRIKAFTVACARCKMGHVFNSNTQAGAWEMAHQKFLTRGLCMTCLTTLHTIFARLQCGSVQESRKGGKKVLIYIGAKSAAAEGADVFIAAPGEITKVEPEAAP